MAGRQGVAGQEEEVGITRGDITAGSCLVSGLWRTEDPAHVTKLKNHTHVSLARDTWPPEIPCSGDLHRGPDKPGIHASGQCSVFMHRSHHYYFLFCKSLLSSEDKSNHVSSLNELADQRRN